MKIRPDWLTSATTQAVMSMLVDAGFQAWAVGGCVRNTLIGMPISDIDIATDARPETVSDLGIRAGFHVAPTGIEHGTVTVVVQGHPYEVTTFRKDVETDGRRAVVAFADRLEDDAHRRDFTMNALYLAPDGTLADPLGGRADLKARRVRFIDDPDQRIREDYLRILRFFRFHAWYGDPARGLDPAGLAACARNAEGLERLSRERVGQEMLRLLAAPDPAPSALAMQEVGVLARVLPGARADALGALVALEHELGLAPEPLRRLACLGGRDARHRLRLSRAQARRLETLREHLGGSESPEELGYRLGADTALDVLALRATPSAEGLPPDVRARVQKGAQAVFPLRGADLADRFSGPQLGAELRAREARWIASGFSLSREDLLK